VLRRVWQWCRGYPRFFAFYGISLQVMSERLIVVREGLERRKRRLVKDISQAQRKYEKEAYNESCTPAVSRVEEVRR